MPPSPAEERGQDVRRRLRTAATELIPERGWSGVSTRILAERAGVTPSVVHYHYPSLRAVLNEAVVELMRQVLEELDATLADDAPEDAIARLVARTTAYTGTDPGSLLAIEGYLAAGRDPELHQVLLDLLATFRGRFTERLRAHDVSAPETTATVLVAAFDGLLLHRGLGSSPEPEALTDVLGRLVAGTTPSGHRNPGPRDSRPRDSRNP